MSARLPRAPLTFEQIVLEFLTDLEQERGLARNTVNAYRSDLVHFGAVLADRGRDALASSTPSWPRSSTSWPTAGRSRPRPSSARSLACARWTCESDGAYGNA
jgi:integrase/recombinase XerD